MLGKAGLARPHTPAPARPPAEMLPFLSEIPPGKDASFARPLSAPKKRAKKPFVPSAKKRKTLSAPPSVTTIPSTSSPGAYGINTPVAPAPLAPLPPPPLPTPFAPPPPSTLITRFPAPAPPVTAMPADIVELVMKKLKSKIPYQCLQPVENLAQTDRRIQRGDYIFPSFIKFLPIIRYAMTCRAAYECGARMGLFCCKGVLRVKVLPERRVSYVKANYYGPDRMSNITFGECICFQALPGVWCLLDEAVAVNQVLRDGWDVNDGHSVRSRMRGCVQHSNLVSFVEEETFQLLQDNTFIFRNRTRHESCLENGLLQIYSLIPTSYFDIPPPPSIFKEDDQVTGVYRDVSYILSNVTFTLSDPVEMNHDTFYIFLWVSINPVHGIILSRLRPDGTYRYKGVRL